MTSINSFLINSWSYFLVSRLLLYIIYCCCHKTWIIKVKPYCFIETEYLEDVVVSIFHFGFTMWVINWRSVVETQTFDSSATLYHLNRQLSLICRHLSLHLFLFCSTLLTFPLVAAFPALPLLPRPPPSSTSSPSEVSRQWATSKGSVCFRHSFWGTREQL